MTKTVDGASSSVTTYTNNALNQMTGWGNGVTNVTYAYDANGNRRQMHRNVDGASSSVTYDYDADNRMISVSDNTPNSSHTFAYDYRSRRYRRTTPTEATYHVFDGGLSIQEYSSPMLSISEADITPYGADQDGQNGKDTAGYSIEGSCGIQLAGNAWKKVPYTVNITSDSVLHFEVMIDDAGEITAIGLDDDSSWNNPVRIFQLAGSQSGAVIQGYEGVPSGEWVSASIPVGQRFTGNMNFITFIRDDDAVGRGTVSFRNIRVSKGSDHNPLTLNTLHTEFIRGEGMGGGVGGMVYSIKRDLTPNTQNLTPTIICSHANHRGDVIARSDETGSLTSFALYEAYGTRPYEWEAAGTLGDPDRQKANTKEEETDLNLLNEGMRYRDLETGVFLTRDPIGYGDGPNVYCYVHCNPITKFDPLGLKTKDDYEEDKEEAEEKRDEEIEDLNKRYIEGSKTYNKKYKSIQKRYDKKVLVAQSAIDKIDAAAAFYNKEVDLWVGGYNFLTGEDKDASEFHVDSNKLDDETKFGSQILAYHTTGKVILGASIVNLGMQFGKMAVKGTARQAFKQGLKSGFDDVLREGVDDIGSMADDMVSWLGKDAKTITNKAGDKIFLSKDGTRRIRFDIKRTSPHNNPHGHVETLKNGRWVKSGPVYPKDVPKN
jgi:RHS repeat-associated protein